ncbi:MAG TPA: hypothetical protein VJP85_08130 [Candidatus Baltobacteraceae bacterium]|nr:hypothetical protein [Candidatus Baltobacteraceae bacterium]
MRLALAIAMIFVSRFAVSAWFDPGRDGDIAWQQWLGLQILHTGSLPLSLGPQAFTAAGAPWIPQEWALSLAVALTLGTPLFAALVAATTLAAAAVLLFTALASRRLGASTVAIGLAVFCVGFSMLESYGIRAQVFGWALLAAVMYLLRCVPGRAKWWIVPLVALWANLHASAMLAPALLALWAAGTALQERAWNAKVREYALLAIASGGAVFLTPLGYRLPLYALELVHSPIRRAITEWQPSSLSAVSFTFGALVLIAGVCILRVERSRRWPELLVIAAVTYMAITAVRNAPVCAIVLAPVVAERLTFKFLPQRVRANALFTERPVLALLYCGAFTAALLSALLLAASPEFKRGDLPQAAIARLASLPGTHRLYCEDFAWCSLALSHENLQDFIDGRADPFPLAVWQDYITVFHVKGDWRAVLDRRRVNAVLVDKKRELAHALPLWRGWRLVYAQGDYRLFIRSGAGSQTGKD